MKFILGTKQEMTQVFDQTGKARAVTVLKVEPALVSQVKTVEKDGYVAAQIATGAQKAHRVNKALAGHLGGAYRFVREYRPRNIAEALDVEKGQTYDAGVFVAGDKITVSSVSKGKGFQGVVKRHGFHGGRASHGQKHSLREPGSIGGGGRAGGRVAKGMRMAGRMGGERVTVRGLTVVEVNPEAGILVVSGAVPGRRGSLVEVRGV